MTLDTQTQDQDARGQISQTQYGNGLTTDRLFDPRTGLIQWIGTSGFGSAVQDLSYTFDMLGNLIWSQYFYAPDLNWVKRQTQGSDAVNATTETVSRIGNVEIVERGGIRELKRTVGGEVQISHRSNGNQRERYLHKDHLGSIDSISNVNGFVVERFPTR